MNMDNAPSPLATPPDAGEDLQRDCGAFAAAHKTMATVLRLSPLNLRGLLHTGGIVRPQDPSSCRPPGRQRQAPIACWRCPVCSQVHDEEDDAESCCQSNCCDPQGGAFAAACPVCEAPANSHRDATDCCLWKDLDAMTRWSVADRVEAGLGTWSEEIARVATHPALPGSKGPAQ